ncbi:MAG: hypothetical protein A2516_00435 [Alphaproteobacteria bacterium RIFOXYD12_FULL_60_8]|nr:MAG: hypothetical protein A2516_00435 [Alphaproteobacteria bacterium RIFOXYD12_FULL_60_8]
MSVGVERLDQDHRRLLEITGQIENAVVSGAANVEIGQLLDSLIDYAEGHLRREEFLMEGLGYEDYGPHRTTHDVFRRWIVDFKERYISEGDPGISESVLEYLNNWWINHILKADMEYKNLFSARKAEVDALLAAFDAENPKAASV